MSLSSLDYELTSWFLARLDDTTGPLWQGVSFVGGGTVMFVGLVSSVLWLMCRKRWHALLTLVVTVPCGILLGEAVKLLVQRQRPSLVGPFVDWSGYSFPSGHAISATLFYGMLCIWLCGMLQAKHWRTLIALGVVLVTLLVSCSRIALGAHYFTDVVAGMIFGVTWMIVCLRGMRIVRERLAVVPCAEAA